MTKIIKTPLTVRVISETPNQPNREQRRKAERARTSFTILTKKHTVGRLTPIKKDFIKRAETEESPETKMHMRGLVFAITKKIGLLKK